jgi:hypothetical protein
MTRRHAPAAATRPALPPAVLIGAVLALCLGWLFKAHCVLDGGWSGGEQYTTGCYTDVVPFWIGRDVASGAMPYFDTELEYPVLTGAQIWLEGAVGRAAVGPDGGALVFLAAVTVVNAGLALGVLVLLHRMGVPPRRLWWWALAPPLVLYLGHNWDLLAIFLLVLAVHLHRRDRPLAAGVAIGLGTASKLFPGLALPLLALTHLRRRDWRAAGALVGGAAASWLLVNLPVALTVPGRWAQFYTFSQQRLGTFAATWTVVDELGLVATDAAQRNLGGSALFALGALVIVAAGWRRHAGREWVLLTPLVAWFLLTNKVWSPQFDLWLYPLLVLTSRRRWPLAAFALADVAVYWTEFWYLGWRQELSPSAPYPALAVAALVRVAVLLAAIWLSVRDRAPEWVERADGDASAAPATVTSPVGVDRS